MSDERVPDPEWNGQDAAITRADVLFIVAFLAGGKSDPILVALTEALEQRWRRPTPEVHARDDFRPAVDLFSDARSRHLVERFKVPRGIPHP